MTDTLADPQGSTVAEVPSPVRSNRGKLNVAYALVGFAPLPGGLLVAKVAAVTIGPAGLGALAAIQAVTATVTLLADANVGQGLIRKSGPEPERVHHFARAARRITLVGALLSTLVVAVISPWAAKSLVGGTHAARNVILASFAGGVTMISLQEINILTTRGRNRSVLGFLLLQGLVGPLSVALVLMKFKMPGIAFAPVLSAVAVLIVGASVVWRNRPRPKPQVSRAETNRAIRELLAFGGPASVAVVLGAGSAALVPIVVRSVLGYEATGWYRAATLVSGGYTAGLLAMMVRSYFPAISSKTDRTLIRGSIERHLRLTTRLISLAGICIVVFSHQILSTLFSSKFTQASGVLRILLLADVLKFAAWCFTFPLLAKLPPSRFVVIEAIGAASVIGFVAVGASLDGLNGAGLGAVLAAFTYLLAAIAMTRHFLGIGLAKTALFEAGLATAMVAAAGMVMATSTLPASLFLTVTAGLIAIAGMRAVNVVLVDLPSLRRPI